jgi:hypothetical protein
MLGTSTFILSLIKDTMLKDDQHMNLFFRMGDIHVVFEILIRY